MKQQSDDTSSQRQVRTTVNRGDRDLPRGVYQRGDSYYVRYKDSTGRWRHRSAGSDLGFARDLQIELLTQATTPDQPTLAPLVQRYLKRLATFGKASTLHTHRVIMRRWVTFFGALPIAEWGSADLENYIAERRAADVAASTINGELAKLKAVLRAAVEDEIIERLPFKITMVPVVKKRSAHVFSRAEIEKLLDCADPRARALLLLASATGMRFGELRHLKWRDVDPESLRVHVREKPEVNWAPKTNQERMLFVPIEVVQQLTAYRASLAPHNGDDDWVFQNKMKPGQHWATSGSVYSSIQAAFKKAGLYKRGKLTHEIRRAVASTMLMNGTPIHVVRDVLGHSNIKQTAEYAFTNEEAMREASTRGIL